jgi:integrase/recombinase XerD
MAADSKVVNGLYRRPAGSYYIRKTLMGRRMTISLSGISTEEAARQCLVALELASLQGREGEWMDTMKKKRAPSTELAAQKWIDHSRDVKKNSPNVIRAKLRTASSISPFVSNVLGSITLGQLEKWVEERNSKAGETTVFDDVKRIKHFFTHCVKRGWIARSPAENLASPRPSRKTQDRAHLASKGVLNSMTFSPKTEGVIAALWGSGLRISELGRVKEQDVHEEHLWVRCDSDDRTKSAKGRRVPIDRATRARLLFVSRFGFDAGEVRREMREECQRAGVQPTITPHVLRHTRASLWSDEGHSIAKIQAWLGHASQATTEGYIHVVAREDVQEELFNAVTIGTGRSS